MAKIILKTVTLTVNGVDLSNRASSAEVNSEKDLVDVTAFGANSKQNLVGLGDGTISIDFFQDFAAASVDATLWPIHNAGSEVVITVKPTNAAVSATNQQIEQAANGHEPELITEVVDGNLATKASWLQGPGDLIECDIDVPGVGTVKVRSLTAGDSNLIATECMQMKGDEMKFDTNRREAMTFAAGVVHEPMFSEQEANVIAHKWGPAFKLVVTVINEISGTQDDALEKARRKFRHLVYKR